MAKRKRKSKNDRIEEKLDQIHCDLKEVREKDIPNIKVDVAVIKEKSSMQAKIISAIGGLIAVAVSTAIAWMK